MDNINQLRILFVEDMPADQELTESELSQAGIQFTPLRVETEPGFLKALDEFKPDLIISDYSLPEFNGMQALLLTQARKLATPFIVLTGSMNEETAVTCMKAGASDYVIKEHIHRLPFAVREALDNQKIKDERNQAYRALRASEAEKTTHNEILHIFLTVSDEEMYSNVLQIILKKMESSYGLFSYMDEDGAAVSPSMTRDVWDGCEVAGKSIRYPRDTWGDSLWVRAVIEKRSLIKNTSGKVPQGHVAIDNALIVPILFRDEVIAHFEVANRVGGYGEAEQQWLEGIAEKVAPMLQARLERDRQEKHRKQAERLLSESEGRYRVLFEKNPSAVLIIDPQNGQIVDSNPRALELYGWTYEEITHKKLSDINPLPEEEIKKNLLLEARENTCLIFQNLIKSGELRDMEVYSGPIEIQGRTLVYSIILDVTERRQAEADLQQRLFETTAVAQMSKALRGAQNEDELLKILLDEVLLLLNATAGAILLHNKDHDDFDPHVQQGWIKELNLGCSEFDRDVVENVFTSGKVVVIPDLKNSSLFSSSMISSIPSGCQAVCMSFRTDVELFGVTIFMASQTRVISEADIRLLSILNGIGAKALQRVRMHANLEDSYNALQSEINIRKGIEELLAKEKKLLSVSLHSIGEGVISTDKNGIIVFYNPAAEVITGYPVSEALGQPIEKIFHLLDRQTQQAAPDPLTYLHQLQNEEKNNLNYRSPTLVTKTGEKILVSGKITPIQVNQEMIDGYILIFDNVTEKELLNAQSTLSQKMEAIGQLAAGIAHEINTPIQYVGDNLNFLNRAFMRFKEINDLYRSLFDDHIDKPFTTEEAHALSEMVKNKKIDQYMQEFPTAIQETLDGIERVRKIVMAIREFSHPSQKEKNLSDVNQGILTTITISHNEWKYCADLKTDLDPTLPLVWCQIDEINQVILNMIVNAAQAIQDKIEKTGEEKGNIWIKTQLKDDKATITLQDTGGGIPSHILNRIFDPFFTTKGVGRGTGQGLSIAHNIIVKKHGGTIRVTSEEGQGTTFFIELPINIPDEGGSGEST